jgi:hypothetical protein
MWNLTLLYGSFLAKAYWHKVKEFLFVPLEHGVEVLVFINIIVLCVNGKVGDDPVAISCTLHEHHASEVTIERHQYFSGISFAESVEPGLFTEILVSQKVAVVNW